jgi:hypothetical protein
LKWAWEDVSEEVRDKEILPVWTSIITLAILGARFRWGCGSSDEKLSAAQRDTKRLDWLLDDLAPDEIGSLDIHEVAYKILHNPAEPATINAEAYAAAYRLAIDAAMAKERDAT